MMLMAACGKYEFAAAGMGHVWVRCGFVGQRVGFQMSWLVGEWDLN